MAFCKPAKFAASEAMLFCCTAAALFLDKPSNSCSAARSMALRLAASISVALAHCSAAIRGPRPKVSRSTKHILAVKLRKPGIRVIVILHLINRAAELPRLGCGQGQGQMSAAHNQSSLVSSATILARSNRISKSMSRATLSAVMACLVGSSAIVCAQPKKQSAVGSRQSAANNKQLAANRQPAVDNRRAAPIPPPTREQMPPQPPRATFRNGLLSIHADNSTMADVMSAIRRATGASLDLPASAPHERVVSDLAPASPT